MRLIHLTVVGLLLATIHLVATGNEALPRVRLETNHGAIVLEIDAARAPVTANLAMA